MNVHLIKDKLKICTIIIVRIKPDRIYSAYI